METSVIKSCELPLRLESWVPTPLPIAYFGPEGQVVRLPFLDLQKKQYVMGVAIGGMCYCKGVFKEVFNYGFIGVLSMLQKMRDDAYPKKSNCLGRILSSESVYARDFVVPSLDQLQSAYLHRHEFEATLQILRDNDIYAESWGECSYICCNSGDCERFDRVVDFGQGIVREYDPYDEMQRARMMVKIVDRDPLYTVEDGVLNWKLWEDCERIYK